jgi:DNA-binding CsgD family transcriptional regulator/PAS domain-containing protein
MPSFRLPPPLQRALPLRNADAAGASRAGDTAAPPQPIIAKDPRLRAFLQVVYGALYDWDIETGVIAFTGQIDEMLGLPPGGFPRNIEGWLERIHPDDHEATMEALAASITGATPFGAEYRLRHRDGSWVIVNDQGVHLTNRSGRVTNMIGAMRDVTAERRAQLAVREATELHRVLFRLPNPAVHVDSDGGYLDADAHALAFFERTREEMLTANVRDDFPPAVWAIIEGEHDGTADPVELDVTCHINGRAKALLLSVIPTQLGDVRSWFLFGADITGQRAMQDELARSERALRRQARILDERNAALRVLLEQREQDRRELEQRIVQNFEQLIEPSLERLSRTLRHQPERLELEAVRVNLREIVGPFAQRVSGGGGGPPLTRRETEIANLVRLGKTSDEIAAALHVSRATVAFHRAGIRRKLGLPKGGPRLSTHLAALGRS